MSSFVFVFKKCMSLGVVAWAFCITSFAQNNNHAFFWSKLKSIEDSSLSAKEKLPLVVRLKQDFEDKKLAHDSVYARILHRIGTLHFMINNNVATKSSIEFLGAAIRINCGGRKDNSGTYCVNSYINLGNFYKSLHLYQLALQYYDSAVIQRNRYQYHEYSPAALMLVKVQMQYRTGDFQKSIEDLSFAIVKARQTGDSSFIPVLLNRRAQSYLLQGRTDDALRDVEVSEVTSEEHNNQNEAINSMLLKADILARDSNFAEVVSLYKRGIAERIKSANYRQVSDDYTDFGNFYFLKLRDYNSAKACYLSTISYAVKANDSERLAKGHINLEQVNLYQLNYKDAERYCIEAMKDLKLISSNDIFINPETSRLNSFGNKELVHVIMENKTELLLKRFLQTRDQRYLTACLETVLLADTMLTNIRNEQLGEQSKLYWRNLTRGFFTNAMEACFLAKDARLAFYFMEKSRAVLLNDKLNELAASTRLPQDEAIKEHELQLAVVSEQQKFSALERSDEGYELQHATLAEAKGTLEHFIRSLEKKYPLYFQYKYADDVPSLDELKRHLKQTNQSFVHYFINDTVAYIMGITPAATKLLKWAKADFNSALLVRYLQMCSYEPTSNVQYSAFTSLSFNLYNLFFKPLAISKGRVVICPDNFLIPFDAMCTDKGGSNFLISDYIFSYVYSARTLLKKNDVLAANGDYIGFAPVTFKNYRDIADLKLSGDALEQSARYYPGSTILANSKASRHNFMSKAPGYAVINVFSHALADTSGLEPVLYMSDSTIRLSELQLLYKPATRLAVLSACQTNVGRNAKGEGVLSLARGFAAAGIPAVAATLWQADEKTVYNISEKFHEFLCQGLPKDEALQKAKLHFITNGHMEKPAPYYWANMILVGDQEPIRLSSNHRAWWWAGVAVLIALIILLVRKLIGKQPL